MLNGTLRIFLVLSISVKAIQLLPTALLAFLLLTQYFASIIFILQLANLEQDLEQGTECDKGNCRISYPLSAIPKKIHPV